MNKRIRKIDDSWLVSYSDVVTSLLAFFVLIVAMSTIDQRKVEYVQEGIQREVLKQNYEKPFSTLEDELKKIVEKQGLQKDVFVEANNTGILITFASSVLYRSGSAELQVNMNGFLQEMSQMIQEMEYKRILIEVEGHTDNLPIKTSVYPSNWELSSARATQVVRFFNRQGIKKTQLKASGYADSRPKVPNDTVQNRSINRRVKVIVRRNDDYNMPNQIQ